MTIAETLAKYYRNVDTRLGGVLPGGVPVGYEGEENVTVTNIPPKILSQTTTMPSEVPTTTTTITTTPSGGISGAYTNLADLQKVIRENQIKNIEDYSTAHAQELYRAFSGDYGPDISSMKQDAVVSNQLKQMFQNLGPEGGKAFQDYKIAYQTAGEARLNELHKLSPSNIQQQDTSVPGYGKLAKEYFASRGDHTHLTFIGPLGIGPEIPADVTSKTLSLATHSVPWSNVDVPLSSETKSAWAQKVGREGYFKSVGYQLTQTPKLYLEGTYIQKQLESSAPKYNQLVKDYDKINKDYTSGKLTDAEYVNAVKPILENKDWQLYDKYAGYTSMKTDYVSNPNISGPMKLGYGATQAAAEIIPWVIPYTSPIWGAESALSGVKDIQAGKITQGALKVGVGGLGIYGGVSGIIKPISSGIAASKTATVTGLRTGFETPMIQSTKLAPALYTTIGLGAAGAQTYFAQKETGNWWYSAGKGIGTAGTILGPQVYKYETAKQYSEFKIKSPQTQLKPTGEYTIDRVPIYTNKEGIIRIPLTGKQYAEVVSSGRIVQSYPRYALQLEKGAEKLGIDWTPKPSWSGNPFGSTIPAGFGDRKVTISRGTALSQRQKAIDDLMFNKGMTYSQASKYLKYTPPKDILSYAITKGAQKTTVSGENFIETKTLQYKIPLKVESSFRNLFGKSVGVKTGGFDLGIIAPSRTSAQMLSGDSSQYIAKSFKPIREIQVAGRLVKTGDFATLLKNPTWIQNNPDLYRVLKDRVAEGLIKNYWVENVQTRNPFTDKISSQYTIKVVGKQGEVLKIGENVNMQGVKISALDKAGKVRIVQQGEGVDFFNPEGRFSRVQSTTQKGYEFELTPDLVPKKGVTITGMKGVQTSGGGAKTYIDKIYEKSGSRWKEITNTYKVTKGTAELSTDWGTVGSGDSVPQLIKTTTKYVPASKVMTTPDIYRLTQPFGGTKTITAVGPTKITGLSAGKYIYKSGYAAQKGRAGSPFPLFDRQESLSFQKYSSPWDLGRSPNGFTFTKTPKPPRGTPGNMAWSEVKGKQGSQIQIGIPKMVGGEGLTEAQLIAERGKAFITSFPLLNRAAIKAVAIPLPATTMVSPNLISPTFGMTITETSLTPVFAPITLPATKSILSPMTTPIVTPVLFPTITPTLTPGTTTIPVAIPSTVTSPVTTPVITPIVTPIVTPVVTPVVMPVVTPTRFPVTTPGYLPSPRTFFPPIALPPKKKKVLKKKSIVKPKGYYVLTMKQKKPFLISPRALIKEQALAFGVRAVSQTARGSFKLIPTTRQPTRIAIKPMSELEVFSKGFRLPIKKGRIQPSNLTFVQVKTKRMSNILEVRDIQRSKRKGGYW